MGIEDSFRATEGLGHPSEDDTAWPAHYATLRRPDPAPQPPPRGKRDKVVIIIVAVLVLTGAGVIAWSFLNG